MLSVDPIRTADRTMGTGSPQTLDTNSTLTWLIAWGDFNASHSKSVPKPFFFVKMPVSIVLNFLYIQINSQFSSTVYSAYKENEFLRQWV
jgi:hypothetical protein